MENSPLQHTVLHPSEVHDAAQCGGHPVLTESGTEYWMKWQEWMPQLMDSFQQHQILRLEGFVKPSLEAFMALDPELLGSVGKEQAKALLLYIAHFTLISCIRCVISRKGFRKCPIRRETEISRRLVQFSSRHCPSQAKEYRTCRSSAFPDAAISISRSLPTIKVWRPYQDDQAPRHPSWFTR